MAFQLPQGTPNLSGPLSQSWSDDAAASSEFVEVRVVKGPAAPVLLTATTSGLLLHSLLLKVRDEAQGG